MIKIVAEIYSPKSRQTSKYDPLQPVKILDFEVNNKISGNSLENDSLVKSCYEKVPDLTSVSFFEVRDTYRRNFAGRYQAGMPTHLLNTPAIYEEWKEEDAN